MTSSLRPEASVAASSVRAIAFSTSALGSSSPAGDWQTTRPFPMKRASVSIWPSVWSFRRPWSIQMIFLAPKASRSAASAWASVQPLRFSLSRVCRVARIVPSPSCSTAPPSSTKSNLRMGVPDIRAMSSPTVVSSGRSNLPPQPLVRNRERHRAALAAGEDRAGIAQPDIAVTRRHDLSRVAKCGAGGSFGLGACNQEPHPVRRAERAHQRRHLCGGVSRGRRSTGPDRRARPSRSPFAAPIRRERKFARQRQFA